MKRRVVLKGAAGLLASLATSEVCAQGVQDKHRVAVIGHSGRGDYGHGLDTVWVRIDRATVVGVADANPAGLAKATSRLKLEPSLGFADYNEMLSTLRPEIVAVCPRHLDQHCDMIVAAIEAGAKGVYVEKPFVRSPSESDRVLAACQKAGAVVAIAHRNRYHPVLKVIDDLVREGRIGRLLEIRARGKGDRRGGGEDLWVLGSHVLNLVHYFAGMPRSCSATLMQDQRRANQKDLREGPEGVGILAGNELHARFQMASGLTAYFDSIAIDGTNNHGFGLQLIGSDGVIAIFVDLNPLAYLIPGNPFQPPESPRRWLPITSGGVDQPEADPQQLERVAHHDAAVDDLIDAVEQGRQPLCDASQGAVTVEMICGVFQSHCEDSRAVTFPLTSREHPLSNW